MDIQLDKSSNTLGVIKISLKETDYQPKFEEKIREYSKKVSLKGFRPGKVPTGLIKKMYGKSVLVEEINDILVKSLQDYIKDNDIKTIGDPIPNDEKAQDIDWDNQKEFEFEYRIGIVNPFEYNLDFKITKNEIKMSDKELDEAIENVRNQFAGVENPDKSEDGDNLHGELKNEEKAFSKEITLLADKLSKKAKKDITGVAKEDVLTFDIKKLYEKESDLALHLNITEEEAKELSGEYQFVVKAINRRVPAELNQDLFDRLLGKDKASSEAEFRTKYKEALESNYALDSDYLLARDIKKKLLKDTKLEVSEEFYKEWLLRANPEISEESLEKDFEHYIEDLKWMLIQNKIADDSKVKVENEDVLQKAKDMFKAQFGMMDVPPELEANLTSFAQNYLSQNDGQNYFQLFNQARTDKVIEVIKGKVEISVKKLSKDEFEKKFEN